MLKKKGEKIKMIRRSGWTQEELRRRQEDQKMEQEMQNNLEPAERGRGGREGGREEEREGESQERGEGERERDRVREGGRGGAFTMPHWSPNSLKNLIYLEANCQQISPTTTTKIRNG